MKKGFILLILLVMSAYLIGDIEVLKVEGDIKRKITNFSDDDLYNYGWLD